jgi:hypothetical protein
MQITGKLAMDRLEDTSFPDSGPLPARHSGSSDSIGEPPTELFLSPRGARHGTKALTPWAWVGIK